MCPRADTPRNQRERAATPARLPQEQLLGEGECPTPDTPQGGTRRPPPPPLGASVPPLQDAKGARKSVRCGVGDGSAHPQPPRPRKKGSGRPPALRTSSWRRETARPRTSLTEARGAPPPAHLCRPHSAQSQLARACAFKRSQIYQRGFWSSEHYGYSITQLSNLEGHLEAPKVRKSCA